MVTGRLTLQQRRLGLQIRLVAMETREGEGEGSKPRQEPWKDFPIDPETGYAKDPDTGAYVDPETGAVLGGSYEGGIDPNASPAPTISPQGEASPSSSPEASPSQMPQTGE